MEARKLRDKHRQKAEIEQKEKGFCAYVNGPNKDILTNKELHEMKKKKHDANPIDSQRKKWHSPPTVAPRIPGQEEYMNPVIFEYAENINSLI